MSKTVFGRKIGMTQSWDSESRVVPLTIVKVDKNVVNRIKTVDTDGYTAVQIAYGNVKNPQKVSKPHKGQFGGKNASKDEEKRPIKKYLKEIRVDETDTYEIGQEFGAEIFETNDTVDVVGTTKGKGFAGVMKRHNFSGVNATHGAHLNHRKPGSIGACATPARVFKGLKMAGRMGTERRTVQNLKIISVDPEKGIIEIKGAIPGAKNSVVQIKSAVKQQAAKTGK
jgi:large subunit ribosomal protein L3